MTLVEAILSVTVIYLLICLYGTKNKKLTTYVITEKLYNGISQRQIVVRGPKVYNDMYGEIVIEVLE